MCHDLATHSFKSCTKEIHEHWGPKGSFTSKKNLVS